MALLPLLLSAALSWGAPRPAEPQSVLFAEGFDKPVSLKFAAGRPYVVEQHGYVRGVRGRLAARRPLIDLHERVTPFEGNSEQGLLDVAFHPDFEHNGRVWVHYTDRDGDTVLSELQADGETADVRTERVLFRLDQPFSNHNGGQIEFGPDGYLYFGLGDGGSKGDPHDHAQSLVVMFGKILRLDVSERGKYQIPPDNPFTKDKDKTNKKAEIWAYGLRNPWRFSFDRDLLFIADVGQNRFEEIDVEDVREGGGRNYGWRVLEGPACYKPAKCDPTKYVEPVHSYKLYVNGECSVIGGYVYRGKAVKALQGRYLFADYCTGLVQSFKYQDGRAVDLRSHPKLNPENRYWENVSSFGRDADGELYVVGYDSGAIYRLAP